MEKPIRIQRSRQHKQVSPNGLAIIYVGRPSKWGNPYPVGGSMNLSVDESIFWYKKYLDKWNMEDEIKKELQGKNLSCWCPAGRKCHADVLIEIANQ